jgi:hypothetical protein
MAVVGLLGGKLREKLMFPAGHGQGILFIFLDSSEYVPLTVIYMIKLEI